MRAAVNVQMVHVVLDAIVLGTEPQPANFTPYHRGAATLAGGAACLGALRNFQSKYSAFAGWTAGRGLGEDNVAHCAAHRKNRKGRHSNLAHVL